MEQPASNIPPRTANPTVNTLLGGIDPAQADAFAQNYNDLYKGVGQSSYQGNPQPGLLGPEPSFHEPDDFHSLFGAHMELNTILGPVMAQTSNYQSYLPSALSSLKGQPGPFNAVDYILDKNNYSRISADVAGPHIVARAISGAYRGMSVDQFLWEAAYDSAKYHFQQRIAQASLGQNLAAGLLASAPEIVATSFIPVPGGGLAKLVTGAGKAMKAGEVGTEAAYLARGAISTSGLNISSASKSVFDMFKPAAGAAVSGALQMGIYGGTREAVYQALNTDRSGYDTANRVMSDMVTGGILGVIAKGIGSVTKRLLPAKAAEEIKQDISQNLLPPGDPLSGVKVGEPQGPTGGPTSQSLLMAEREAGTTGAPSINEPGASGDIRTPEQILQEQITDAVLDASKRGDIIPSVTDGENFVVPAKKAEPSPYAGSGPVNIEDIRGMSRAEAEQFAGRKLSDIEFESGKVAMPRPEIEVTDHEFLQDQLKIVTSGMEKVTNKLNKLWSNSPEEFKQYSTFLRMFAKNLEKYIDNPDINPHEALKGLEKASERFRKMVYRDANPPTVMQDLEFEFRSNVERFRHNYDKAIAERIKNQDPALAKAKDQVVLEFDNQQVKRAAANFSSLRTAAEEILKENPQSNIAQMVLTNIDRFKDEGVTVPDLMEKMRQSVSTWKKVVGDSSKGPAGEVQPSDLSLAERELFADYEAEVFAHRKGYKDAKDANTDHVNMMTKADIPRPRLEAAKAKNQAPIAEIPSVPAVPVGFQHIDPKTQVMLNELVPGGIYKIENGYIYVQQAKIENGIQTGWEEAWTLPTQPHPEFVQEALASNLLGGAAKDLESGKSAPAKTQATQTVSNIGTGQAVEGEMLPPPPFGTANVQTITLLTDNAVMRIRGENLADLIYRGPPSFRGPPGEPPGTTFAEPPGEPSPKPATAQEVRKAADETIQAVRDQVDKSSFMSALKGGLIAGAISSAEMRQLILKAMGLVTPAMLWKTYTADQKEISNNVPLQIAADFAMWTQVLAALPESKDKEELLDQLSLIRGAKTGHIADLNSFNNGVIRLLGTVMSKDPQISKNNETLLKVLGMSKSAGVIGDSLIAAMLPIEQRAADVAQRYHDAATQDGIKAIATALKSVLGEMYPDKSLSYNVRYLSSKVDKQLPGPYKALWQNIFAQYFAPLGRINERALDGLNDKGAGESGHMIMDHAIHALVSHLEDGPVSGEYVRKHVNESIVADFAGLTNGLQRPAYMSMDTEHDLRSLALKDFGYKYVNTTQENLPFIKRMILLNNTNRAMAVQKAVDSVYGAH